MQKEATYDVQNVLETVDALENVNICTDNADLCHEAAKMLRAILEEWELRDHAYFMARGVRS